MLIPALVVLYVFVRCLNLDLFVTTDEPFWLGRSANFYRALTQGDFAHTYQMAHPGVLTMWAGMVAYLWKFPEYTQYVTANLNHVYGIDGVLRELGQDPMRILVAARFVKILLQGVMFGISLGCLNHLFGRNVMVLTGLLITFDPFLSGMDSLLHVDGLFAICSLAALLAIASAAQSPPDAMVPWITAGVLSACAWMTRATGLLLVAVIAGIALLQVLARLRTRQYGSFRAVLEAPAFGGMLWATGSMAASILLLPALWVDPFGTMQQIWNWSSNAATEGHERPTFFLGEIHQGDPGAWFYPVTLLWRLTPVSLLGLLAFLVLLPVGYRRGWIKRNHLQTLVVLIAFAVAYTLAMTFGAKKFDRYILPVYPIVSVIAAVGGVLFARFLHSWRSQWRQFALPAIASLLVAGQLASLVGSAPYRLNYFNPLLGGLASAQHQVQLGWGEGGSEVMNFIMEDANGRQVNVQKSSATPIFSYFSTPNIHFVDFGMDTPAGWYETDYFVPGIQEWQRNLSPSYHLMQEYEPAYIVRIREVTFFQVFTPRTLPLPESLQMVTGCTSTFGGVQLMQIIGRAGMIDLYWLTTGAALAQLDISVTLVAPEESALPAQTATWDIAPKGIMSRVTIADPRPDDSVPLDQHTIIIQVSDSATDEVLPVISSRGGESADSFTTHSECYYTAPG